MSPHLATVVDFVGLSAWCVICVFCVLYGMKSSSGISIMSPHLATVVDFVGLSVCVVNVWQNLRFLGPVLYVGGVQVAVCCCGCFCARNACVWTSTLYAMRIGRVTCMSRVGSVECRNLYLLLDGAWDAVHCHKAQHVSVEREGGVGCHWDLVCKACAWQKIN